MSDSREVPDLGAKKIILSKNTVFSGRFGAKAGNFR